jgi:hypothetical protein
VLSFSLAASPAKAAGGAHVIDDATVETPGTCHLESWVTLYNGDRGLLNPSPACTRKAWPNLEIGASIQHTWDRLGTRASVRRSSSTLRPWNAAWALRSPWLEPGTSTMGISRLPASSFR